MPRLIKFPDGRSCRPVDIERVDYNSNYVEGQTAGIVWVVRALLTGGDDWIYKNNLASEEEAQAECSKLTDEINKSA